MKTVVIDAGHGGHDPGCLGSDSREKHITLAVAKRVAAVIQAAHPDLRVILTRDTDVFIPLHERAAIANRNQADLFISIHCNFMPGKASVQGSETYVMGLHTAEHNLSVAKRENASILLEENYEANYDYDPNSPEGHITLSMFQSAFIEQSIFFADLVEKQFAQAGRKSRGVRQAGFVVLKASAMPSALIEIGYLSNKDEETFLKGEDGQNIVANAILNAFGQYRTHLEGPTSMAPIVVASPEPPAAVSAPKPEPAKPVAKQAVLSPPATAAPPNGQVKPEGIPLGNISTGSSNEVVSYDYAGAAKPAGPAAKSAAPSAAAARTSWPEPDRPVVIGQSSRAAGNTAAALSPRGGETPAEKPAAASLQFCIQLSAASAPADTGQGPWKNLGYKVDEVQEDGKFKYQIRNLSTYEQAHEIRQKAISGGFPGAFIVAYKDGRRIPIEEALRSSR